MVTVVALQFLNLMTATDPVLQGQDRVIPVYPVPLSESTEDLISEKPVLHSPPLCGLTQ